MMQLKRREQGIKTRTGESWRCAFTLYFYQIGWQGAQE
ncbi:hypothetical protein DB29_02173 [Shouchella clausii]|nr:hypothetical protein DB29_02173 [Shouchella clausii]